MRVSSWPFFRLAALVITSAAFAPSVSAQAVGGAIPLINTLSVSHVDNLSIVANVARTDVTVVTGTINNNSPTGWVLTVTSGNSGKLLRAGTTGGAGREVPYNQVKFAKTGGTLGAGLSDPNGTSNNIASTGTVNFSTVTKVATTSTVGYTFDLKISWDADTRLIEGTYTDTLTATLAVDI